MLPNNKARKQTIKLHKYLQLRRKERKKTNERLCAKKNEKSKQ